MIAVQEIKTKTKPFLKWAGGKTQLLKDIETRLPKGLFTGEITKYIEPFVGGGAVFFYIAQNFPQIKKFYLYDVNFDRVNCYQIVKTNVGNLIKQLKKLENDFLPLNEDKRKDFYLDCRIKFNKTKHKGGVGAAALLIFLNRTCFNGLYRVNSKDKFNVPFGRYKNPKICNEDNLIAVSAILQKTEIICGDFTECRKHANKKTFIYFDPPYRPLSATANFTSYSKNGFSEQDQLRLADFCKAIHKKEIKFLLSNSDPKNEVTDDCFFEDNFEQFEIETVKARRIINCKAIGRGQIYELIIANYNKVIAYAR